MISRGRQASIVASPVLVGAVTVLVTVVAVFLAYNANSGLPFVPTTQLKVHTANGANLVKGNEVRQGGFRIGVVQDLRPVALPGGKVGAELDLKLDKVAGEVPVDSRVRIRPRSALGLKYVELTRGRSRETLPDGGTLPASQASIPVELDEVFSTFDPPTRQAAQENLDGFGTALAGRGEDLNELLRQAPELFGRLEPVAANLADPDTALAQFFGELGETARILRPVSKVNARLFSDMATTFEAISRDPDALKATISKSPPTLAEGERSLRAQRPFLRNTAAFSRDLSAAAGELRGALPIVNEALEVGTPVVRRSVGLNDDLQGTLRALRDLTDAPTTDTALRALTATVTTLQPQLRYLGPYVTVCNYWNTFWTFTAEHFTAPDSTGTSQRALLNSGAPQDDSLTSQGANEFATGRNVLEPGGIRQFVHNNFYPSAVDRKGNADCEAGQQGYGYRGNAHDTTADGFYERTVVEPPPGRGPDFTGNQGPTFDRYGRNARGIGLNRATVPPGQTFTREPGGRGATVDPITVDQLKGRGG
ncbi:MAG: MCE family protein [Solirubrobacterales bacterium]|nr:MCE family protein [Solirubrobacterales bacterium]